MVENRIVKQFKKSFKLKEERGWDKIYVLVDLHDTIMKATYRNDVEPYDFYYYSIPSLATMCLDPEICLILWTCTPEENLNENIEHLKHFGISFDYINENPEVLNNEVSNFDKKLYCNVLLDDKAGFDPEEDWKLIYNYLHERIYCKRN